MSHPNPPPSGTQRNPKSDRRRWGHAQLDHIVDPYKRAEKLHEPTACPQCGAVYSKGRWQWLPVPDGAEKTLCQACHRTNDGYPAGIVTLSGRQVALHREEMISLARHQESAERADHPMNRIIGIEGDGDEVAITTTDIHLPRRIARAMSRAFHGEADEHFDENGYFVRVNWHRD